MDIALITAAIHESLFYQIAILLVFAGTIGLAAHYMRQPLIVAYILVGLLAGPEFLDILAGDAAHSGPMHTLAALGIALLLFLVGLKLDLNLVRKLGTVALMSGAAQVTLTAGAGFTLCYMLGYGMTESIILAIALSFSSTIIVVKLLSDKREIDSLYGKIALGILIVQDLVVILSMVAVTALANSGAEGVSISQFAAIFGKLAILIACMLLFMKFLADPLTNRLARLPELMSIFAIAMAAIMAAICHYLGLSKEMGGLLAGMALASTPYRDVIAARLHPLRDFLLLFFFIGLGATLQLDSLSDSVKMAGILTVFVLLLKPLIIMAVVAWLGYRKRTAFMSGITLGQISEFSLIFVTMAAAAGLIGADAQGVVTLVGMITIAVSTYGITYGARMYPLFEKAIGWLERKQPKFGEESDDCTPKSHYDVIIFGMGRYGSSMARQLKEQGKQVLGVDFDPAAVRQARENGIDAVYGDATDPEFPTTLPLHDATAVVLAMPHMAIGPLHTDTRRMLSRIIREMGYKGHIAAASHFRDLEQDLYDHGVSVILCPFEHAAERAADQILSLKHKT